MRLLISSLAEWPQIETNDITSRKCVEGGTSLAAGIARRPRLLRF